MPKSRLVDLDVVATMDRMQRTASPMEDAILFVFTYEASLIYSVCLPSLRACHSNSHDERSSVPMLLPSMLGHAPCRAIAAYDSARRRSLPLHLGVTAASSALALACRMSGRNSSSLGSSSLTPQYDSTHAWPPHAQGTHFLHAFQLPTGFCATV